MIVFSILLLLLGLVLLGGGVWLVSLGGSLFYAIAGIALIVAGVAAKGRRPIARWVYAVFLAGAAAWALWESGFDWWPLATRLGLFLLLAIPLLFPGPTSQRGGVIALFPVWVVVGVITVSSLAFDQHRVDGLLNQDIVSADPEMGDMSDEDWQAYGRSNLGQRYSPLDQITVDNAGNLEKAWEYQTGDLQGPDDVGEITYEATPIKVGNSLFLCTPHNWLVALDADTGEEQWVYNAKVPMESQRQHQTCRGVSYMPPSESDANAINVKAVNEPAEDLASVQCDAQLFMPTSDARLLAVDPETGARCSDFAEDGSLDLMHNMPSKQDGFYYSTSPPVVANGLVVVAGAVNDNYDIDSPSGVIRAYDVKTGELKWNWDPGHPENTAPIGEDETYSKSSPNSWAVASADEELGLIYFPMGNRVPDQLGMYRSENDEKYASSVVALSLETGQVAWVHQFVHHDLWDMDTPAQPSLVDLKTENGEEPALVVPTKQGDVYVLNRKTGEAIIPVSEQKAPQGTIEGDYASATQPISGLNFRPPALTESDMWGASVVDQMICRIKFRSLRYEGQYTPPSEQGTLVYPGNFGVFNWGGIAVDPERQVMFGMPLYLAFTSTLVPKEGAELGETNQGEQGVNENAGAPYAVDMKPFLSPLGIPCQQPPWGYVAGADLRTGEVVWKQKNGTVYDMTPLPLPIEMGVPGIGGPIITGGGVAFLAASVDNYLRAYNLTTGEQIWEERLPAGGQATPMTYLNSKGEQMVVLVAGGHGSIGTTFGDYVIAYKLP